MPETLDETVKYLSSIELERKAAEILSSHNLTTVPIDLLALAARSNITVNNARFSDRNMAGMIVKRGDEVSILVNGDDSPLRKRFTIAHELGHYFLHLSEDGEFVDTELTLYRQRPPDEHSASARERRKEIQANGFAAALLMPESQVRRYWKERKSIDELARIFNVSTEAMGYRLDALELD
jgi:Zn-dependent peptidase ImmA (M78 family)